MYKRGDLVWAKMKGFPPWPGIIAAPPEELRRQPIKRSALNYCIFFFGSNNYSWIEAHKLDRYKKGPVAISGKRSAGLREAIAAIDAYIDNGEGGEHFDVTPEVDVFDKLLNESRASSDTTLPPPSPMKKFGQYEGDTDDTDDDNTENGNLSDTSSGSSVIVLSTKAVNLNIISSNNSNKVGGTELSKENQTSKSVKDVNVDDKCLDKNNDVNKSDTITKSNREEPSCSKDVLGDKKDNKEKKSDKVVTTSPIIIDLDSSFEDSTDVPDDNNKQNQKKSTSEEVSYKDLNTLAIKKNSFVNLGVRVKPSDYLQYSCKSPEAKRPSKSLELKSRITSHSEYKKRRLQQVVKARPFRHIPKVLAKARVVEPSSDDGPTTSSSSTPTSKRTSGSSSIPSSCESKTEAKKRKRREVSESEATSSETSNTSNTEDIGNTGSLPRSPASLILKRPCPSISSPDTPRLNLFTVSQTLLDKHITPSTLRFGFLGLGIMGSAIVKNLLNSGHRVIVWNRTPDKCRVFAGVGAEMAVTPQDVCTAADIIFSCVAGPKAAKEMVFGNCGALSEMNPSKAYVEMTNIDTETSLDINEAIMSRGARYLEAQIQGSLPEAEEGKLVLLCAGDRSLFDSCHTCFEAIGSASFFFGDVGNATKMNLVIQMMCATVLAGLAEGMALLDRFGLLQSDLLDVINLTSLKSKLIMDKGALMKNCSFPTNLALTHMQRDVRLGISSAEDIGMPTPIFSAVNEAYKQTKHMGYGDHDVSAVYVRSRY